ncbi:putative toxin [Nocardia brasiliensis]|uniref:putative toxin n=1 Tax=Nocardia brasiliensis TaxID=37326 RepID=UPI00245483D6|nr:putative toxin [Nocardia brasiliensis]
MTTVRPEWYWDAARQLGDLSTRLQQRLSELDDSLDVSRSAGVHTTAGTAWAAAYSQSAVDVFELASLVAIAAGNLAKMVHTAGANHVNAENKSAADKPQIPVAALPTVSTLPHAAHPTELCSGGLGDIPERWGLIEGRHRKAWADCDVGKIGRAGEMFGKFSTDFKNVQIRIDIYADGPPDVPMIRGAVGKLLTALDTVSDLSRYLSDACHLVADKSRIERQSIEALLRQCAIAVGFWEVTAKAPLLGPLARRTIEANIRELKDTAGRHTDILLTELDGFVDSAVQQTGGSMALATGDAQFWLAPMLGRYARQRYPVQGRNLFDNIYAGRDGERRAGIDPDAPKRAVRISGNVRIPDRIDDENRQVTEVKNVNDAGRYEAQIKDEAAWAAQNGYTMNLIVDHRTQLSPDLAQLAREGKITVIRQELDDNIPGGQQATPFVPKPDWAPPMDKDPRGATGVPRP